MKYQVFVGGRLFRTYTTRDGAEAGAAKRKFITGKKTVIKPVPEAKSKYTQSHNFACVNGRVMKVKA